MLLQQGSIEIPQHYSNTSSVAKLFCSTGHLSLKKMRGSAFCRFPSPLFSPVQSPHVSHVIPNMCNSYFSTGSVCQTGNTTNSTRSFLSLSRYRNQGSPLPSWLGPVKCRVTLPRTPMITMYPSHYFVCTQHVTVPPACITPAHPSQLKHMALGLLRRDGGNERPQR